MQHRSVTVQHSKCRALAPNATRRRVVATRASTTAVDTDSWKQQLKGARADVEALIRATHANPILIRLAWHDSGTFDENIKQAWPKPGGATASIRFNPEIGHGANAGLQAALDLVEPVKQKYPLVSYADLYQMASAIGVEIAGGPAIPLRYGRVDVESPEDCAPEGRLPSAGHPFSDGSKTPADHLRKIFYRMGLNDKDIVALSGAHTLGRSRPERSGWGKEETKYTTAPNNPPGSAPGGQSWTANWLTFDNSYFVEVKAKRDADLLILPTDAAVFEDEGFRQYAEKYAEDQDAFFKDYVESHLKLSELGSKFTEGTKVTLE